MIERSQVTILIAVLKNQILLKLCCSVNYICIGLQTKHKEMMFHWTKRKINKAFYGKDHKSIVYSMP